jgi:predicted ATP-grasp superfamily ATP-dependent carboligase
MELARLFARQGHEVYLAESFKFPLTRFSNSITRYIHVPEARFKPREYVNALSNIIAAERIDVFIPNLEEIFYVARSVESFPPGCIVWADTFEKLDMLHNKWTFIEYLKTIGFKTPETEQASSREKLISRLANFSSEKAIVKPAYSRFASQSFICNRGDRLPTSIQPTETRPWIVQEFIDGHHLCTYSLAQKERVLAHSSYPSQQQWGIGPSTVFEYENNPNAQKWVERFISKTKFTGQIGFDFIETLSGILYPIECNPRATSGIHLFNKTPEFVEQFLGGQKQKVVFPRGGEVRSVKFWLVARLIRLIITIQPMREWKKTWQCLRRSNDVLYQKGDMWPYFGHMISFAEVLFQSVRLGISPKETVTRDCDYNGIDESTGIEELNCKRRIYP